MTINEKLIIPPTDKLTGNLTYDRGWKTGWKEAIITVLEFLDEQRKMDKNERTKPV